MGGAIIIIIILSHHHLIAFSINYYYIILPYKILNTFMVKGRGGKKETEIDEKRTLDFRIRLRYTDKSRVWMMMATTKRSVMNLVDLNLHASHTYYEGVGVTIWFITNHLFTERIRMYRLCSYQQIYVIYRIILTRTGSHVHYAVKYLLFFRLCLSFVYCQIVFMERPAWTRFILY